MAKKHRTTGALNKAERFILGICQAEPHFNLKTLSVAVCEKLNISTDGWKYADVPRPKLPPEYQAAIDTAMKVSHQLWKERQA